MHEAGAALIRSNPAVLGILLAVLALVFWTSALEHRWWKAFYRVVPALLLCYFLPGLLNTLGIIDGHDSDLYPVARDYLLPTALVLLTISSDFSGMLRLGPKALVMFLTGTASVVIGGPLALWLIGMLDPALIASGGSGPGAVWRGMTTVAGSWIGGGANQAAMKVVFDVGSDNFARFIAVDVLVANLWMAVLLWLAGRAARIDAWNRADTRALDDLRLRIERFQTQHARIPGLTDLVLIVALGFGITGLAHVLAGVIAPWLAAHAPGLERFSLTSHFFWVVVLATGFGLALSFTRARRLEGAGASRIGSVCLYVLIATIGMHMDLRTVFSEPWLFALGAIWISVHGIAMLIMARLIRAPVFYMAVGSQANIGGAASAPVVASAFHPSLAPVGVLLAVFGYSLGTYAAWVCGQLLRMVAGN